MYAVITSNKAERLNQYAKGLADEAKVIEFLKTQGYEVNPSCFEDNKNRDIDCYVNGKSVSIKSNHKGVQFRHICFELINQLTTYKNDEESRVTLSKVPTMDDVNRLRATNAWEPGWYYTGEAANYLFYQGDKLRLYTKKSIQLHLELHGFIKIRALTEETKSYLGGRYRHCNTISGYLNWDSVPHKTWSIE
jgi:hypothetical protein